MVWRKLWLISRITIQIIRTKLQRLPIIPSPPMVAAELQEAAWPVIKVHLSPSDQAQGPKKLTHPPYLLCCCCGQGPSKVCAAAAKKKNETVSGDPHAFCLEEPVISPKGSPKSSTRLPGNQI